MFYAASTGHPLPPALRSRAELETRGFVFSPPSKVPAKLPIQCDGATYNAAQTAVWLDDRHFAVGRWDGSMSVFAFDRSPTSGPDITASVSSPATEGVQMIARLGPNTLATTNDVCSMSLWSAPGGVWGDLHSTGSLQYDPTFGPATSGTAGQQLLVVGHANGFVTVWLPALVGSHSLRHTVDVRSANPVNPWGLHHVRGVSWVDLDGIAVVVTGSEDGDICMVGLSDGTILARTTYNPTAERGINAIAVQGQDLLVANCAVGDDDNNLWYFRFDPAGSGLTLCDRVNLRIAPELPQVFNFSVVWGKYSGGDCFFCSTQEGELWMGTVRDEAIVLLGHADIGTTCELGSALAYAEDGRLVLAAHDLYEFKTLA